MPLVTIKLQGPEKERISKVQVGSTSWFVSIGGDYLPSEEVDSGEVTIKVFGEGGYDIYQTEQTRVLPDYSIEMILTIYSYDFDVDIKW